MTEESFKGGKGGALSGNRVVKEGRRMMSRRRGDGIHLLRSLTPGEDTTGCCVCCSAPACCPMLSVMPCCDHSKYIVAHRDASKYVFVRENSLEWNAPEIVWESGSWLGIDPCMYTVLDNPQVVYFDDPIFDYISDQTRCCNETRTCLNGGNGEIVHLDSRCFWGMCYRSHSPCPCVPTFAPLACFPCARRKIIYLKDAAEGIHAIKQAVRNAREHDTLYHVPSDSDEWSNIVSGRSMKDGKVGGAPGGRDGDADDASPSAEQYAPVDVEIPAHWVD
jgi:hypothetical protein